MNRSLAMAQTPAPPRSEVFVKRRSIEPDVLARLDRLEDRLAEMEERLDLAERTMPRPGQSKVAEALPPKRQLQEP
jgi:hypothetical protein